MRAGLRISESRGQTLEWWLSLGTGMQATYLAEERLRGREAKRAHQQASARRKGGRR